MDDPARLSGLPEGIAARAATWDDVDAVTSLVAACELLHDGVSAVHREDIVADWARSSFDLTRHSVVATSGDAMVAEVDVFDGRAEANVHPDWRGRGLGTWVLGQAERIAREQRAPRAAQTLSDRATDAVALLRRHGYGHLYTSWVLRIENEQRPLPPDLPADVVFRNYVPGDDDRAVFQVIEDAFSEWPNRLPSTFEDWYPMILGRESFEPWMVLLAAEEATGEIVGVANVIDQDLDAGWVQQLATKATHRHRGIGRALMRRAMTVFWDLGKPGLEVATDSRTGALGLYEQIGMHVVASYTNHAKDLTYASEADRSGPETAPSSQDRPVLPPPTYGSLPDLEDFAPLRAEIPRHPSSFGGRETISSSTSNQ